MIKEKEIIGKTMIKEREEVKTAIKGRRGKKDNKREREEVKTAIKWIEKR